MKLIESSSASTSATGYIHMTVEELCAGALVHLISGVDAQDGLARAGAVVTEITGYTEWVSAGGRLLTIGWDWQMTATGLQRISPPSSNLMLQSRARRDLGHARTVELLKDYLDGFNWQPVTLGHIGKRYG